MSSRVAPYLGGCHVIQGSLGLGLAQSFLLQLLFQLLYLVFILCFQTLQLQIEMTLDLTKTVYNDTPDISGKCI